MEHTQPEPADTGGILNSTCTGGQPHDWRLTEDGYTRWWHTTITGTTIRAAFDGSGDWSDTGTGEHLECQRCWTTTPVPAGFTVDYV